MKLLKLGIIGLFAMSLLSSCLGDSDSEFSTTTFAYVQQSKTGTVYATTPFMDITSTKIQQMDVGSCALLYFKVKNYGSGINDAEVNVEEENLYKSEFRTMNPTIDPADEVYPTALSFDNTRYNSYNGGYYAFESNFGDYWLFSTKFNFEKDTPVGVYFIYDENNQKITDDEGNPVGEQPDPTKNNYIVIDVRFEKNPSRDSFTAPKSQGEKYSVTGMRPLRYLLDPVDHNSETGSKYILVPIKFRYTKNVKKTGSADEWERKETIIGSWENTSSSFRCMAFEKPE